MPNEFALDTTGFDAMLRRLKHEAPGAVGAALYQTGLRVIRRAIHLTPVDTGRLRSTAYCTPPHVAGEEIYVTVGYGTAYAIFVHERVDLHHAVGEAKFLEKAIDEVHGDYSARLLALVLDNLAHGVVTAAVDAGVPTERPAGGDELPSEPKRSGTG